VTRATPHTAGGGLLRAAAAGGVLAAGAAMLLAAPGAGFEARVGRYDFVSSPLAGLFPGWRAGYRAARVLDDLLVRTPLVERLGSNFEIMARWSR